jgi:hypothetical protein
MLVMSVVARSQSARTRRRVFCMGPRFTRGAGLPHSAPNDFEVGGRVAALWLGRWRFLGVSRGCSPGWYLCVCQSLALGDWPHALPPACLQRVRCKCTSERSWSCTLQLRVTIKFQAKPQPVKTSVPRLQHTTNSRVPPPLLKQCATITNNCEHTAHRCAAVAC